MYENWLPHKIIFTLQASHSGKKRDKVYEFFNEENDKMWKLSQYNIFRAVGP